MSELIDNSEVVTKIYGAWPSFHDAEVLRVVLDRSGAYGPILEVRIHVFKMTDEVGPNGTYVLRDHSLVTLLFSGVALEKIEHFNQQNVLQGLHILAINPDQNAGRRLSVAMPASYGLQALFECKRCEVINIQPYVVSA